MEKEGKRASLYRTLGDENRLKILDLLLEGELCASQLQERLPVGQSTLSHHMKLLREAGLVRCRRQGQRTYYALEPAAFADLKNQMALWSRSGEGILVPGPVLPVLERLEKAGFGAWTVGGCVRDSLRGAAPLDWDLCTQARPEQVKAVFADYRVVDTGLRHGTVTLKTPQGDFEITTLRRDSGYSDHRRPDSVIFTSRLEEDLARRDFTVNAMAAGRSGAVVDPFGGREDLSRGVLRAVGDPEVRFREDGLRILRGLRFCATLGLHPEPATGQALLDCRELLGYVAPERIWTELKKLLVGPAAGQVLLTQTQVLGVILPEILPTVGLDQKNPHHMYDVWGHTVAAVCAGPADPVVRFALLLHDLGKPGTMTETGPEGRRFYGHAKMSGHLAEGICARLRLSREERDLVCNLVSYHDIIPKDSDLFVKQMCHQWGGSFFRKLIAVMRADNLAQSPEYWNRQRTLLSLEHRLDELERQGACMELSQLAVKGRDLLALGYQGPAVGRTLQQLLELVMEGKAENNREELLARLKSPGDI